jgi:hypothetical protein
MKTVSRVFGVLTAGGVYFCLTGCAASGADAQTAADVASAVADGGAVSTFLESVARNYPWVTVALLVVGALRVVFKPVMMLLDSYVKANCSSEEYARIQSFESGSIYKWICFGLDLVGSVKLPVVSAKLTSTSTSTATTGTSVATSSTAATATATTVSSSAAAGQTTKN